MNNATRALHSVAQARALDRRAIEQFGIAGFELMRRAGEAAARQALQRYPLADRICVLAGPGNNGGDGYVVASALSRARREVCVLALGGRLPQSGDAATACQQWQRDGGTVAPLGELPDADLYVDALFGIGLTRALEGAAAEGVTALNARSEPVLALDVPSGLNADSGAALGIALVADATVTFIVDKRGLHTGQAPALTGPVLVEDLALPEPLLRSEMALAELLAEADLDRWLGKRRRDAHKGNFGRVLVIGGDEGYGGAVRLAGEAAARSGAGLVNVITRPAHVAPLLAGRPELMVRGSDHPDQLRALADAADVVVVGPGLGRSDWSQRCLELALSCAKPLVVDADGLNLLAAEPRALSPGSILTPHPAEAGRLLGISTAEVQQDRYAAVKGLARAYSAVSVLKGAGSLVCAPPTDAGSSSIEDRIPSVCPYGNPGMATGGSGDVLAGVCAGLLAQHLDAYSAARAAVLAHALAGDLAAGDGERGMLAGDLLSPLRRVLNR